VTRFQVTFAALVAAQAAHSVEEYIGHLYEVFPPARFVSGLISQNLRLGFIIFNLSLIAFGVWCCLWPVRRGTPPLAVVTWFWIVIELINGVGHPIWSIGLMRYTPGVATAPVLLILAIALARQALGGAPGAVEMARSPGPSTRF
jgi:Protein of unknown function with HXXEE motif